MVEGKKRERKPTGKQRYFKHYEVIVTLREDGRGEKKTLVYIGDYYRLKVPEGYAGEPSRYVRTLRIKYAMMFILYAGIFTAMGLIDSGASGVQPAAYVLIPYALLLLPIFYIIFNGIELIIQKGDIELPVYERGVRRVRGFTIALCALAAICAVGEGIYIALAPGGALWQQILFMALALLLAGLSYYFICIQKGIAYDIIARNRADCAESPAEDGEEPQLRDGEAPKKYYD